MSIFKSEWIVLKTIKIDEKEMLYKIFFREYGILSVKKKKKARERPIDIGYYMSCEISTQTGRTIHSIGNIKVISFFNAKEKKYSEIRLFLWLCKYLLLHIPEGNPHYELFSLLSALLSQKDLTQDQILLANLKTLHIFGELTDTHEHVDCQKILRFIHNNPCRDILRLKHMPEEANEKLQKLL
jgi:recombinational DNA repair protein (RecF pathway)